MLIWRFKTKKKIPDFLCVIRQTLDKYTWKLGVFRKLFLSAYWEGPKPFKNAIKEQIICTTYYRLLTICKAFKVTP